MCVESVLSGIIFIEDEINLPYFNKVLEIVSINQNNKYYSMLFISCVGLASVNEIKISSSIS